MHRYPAYSSRRRKSKRKWVAFVLILAAFLAAKTYFGRLQPRAGLADVDRSIAALGLTDVNQPEPGAALALPAPAASPLQDTKPLSPADAAQIASDIKACMDANPSEIVKARNKLNAMLSDSLADQQLKYVQSQLTALADQWLFSSTIITGDKLCAKYTVRPGDTFTAIERRFKVPYETLMRINNITNPYALRAGRTIKVINGPFNCRVHRSAFKMDLFLQDYYIRSFAVSVGKPGMETPTGKWLVKAGGKLVTPRWTDPQTGKTYTPDSPDYPLGARWIALEGLEGEAVGRTGFAIHGTNNPAELAAASSQGCIRVSDEDVLFIYDLLFPKASEVTVLD